MSRNGIPPIPNAKGRKAKTSPNGPTSMKAKKPKTKKPKTKKSVKRYSLTDDLVMQGIEACNGNITKIADMLGQKRNYVSMYIRAQDKDGNYVRPDLVKMLEEYQVEVPADLAEWELHQAVSRGEPWAVAMVAKTLRRHRYGDKLELEQVEHTIKTTEIVVVHHKADSSPLRVAVGGDAPDSDQERIEAEPPSGAAESLEQ